LQKRRLLDSRIRRNRGFEQDDRRCDIDTLAGLDAILDSVSVADVIDATDVRMIERRYGTGFTLEARAHV